MGPSGDLSVWCGPAVAVGVRKQKVAFKSYLLSYLFETIGFLSCSGQSSSLPSTACRLRSDGKRHDVSSPGFEYGAARLGRAHPVSPVWAGPRTVRVGAVVGT